MVECSKAKTQTKSQSAELPQESKRSALGCCRGKIHWKKSTNRVRGIKYPMIFWLVVSTHLKNRSSNWIISPNKVQKNVWNHHPVFQMYHDVDSSFLGPCKSQDFQLQGLWLQWNLCPCGFSCKLTSNKSNTSRYYMGVSKNRGTPNGWFITENPYILKWMIWGYHYFRKHLYIYICNVYYNVRCIPKRQFVSWTKWSFKVSPPHLDHLKDLVVHVAIPVETWSMDLPSQVVRCQTKKTYLQISHEFQNAISWCHLANLKSSRISLFSGTVRLAILRFVVAIRDDYGPSQSSVLLQKLDETSQLQRIPYHAWIGWLLNMVIPCHSIILYSSPHIQVKIHFGV